MDDLKYTGDYLPQEQQQFLHETQDMPFKESAEALQKKYMEGLSDSGGLMSNPPRDTETSYGLSNDLYEAIQKKARLPFERAKQELKNVAGMDSVTAKFARMQQAAALSNAEMKYNEQVRQAKYQELINRQRARAQALGNILGIAGAIGGGLAGGPSGAGAGYMAGQGAGNLTAGV